MFATYKLAAAASIENLLADMVAILTGTTDKTTLSAACDQAGTEILTTYTAAGWTMHDDVSSTVKVIKADVLETGFTKYLYITISGTGFRHASYESWNATTHVGTNGTSLSSTPSSLNSVGNVHRFYATARTIQAQLISSGTNSYMPFCYELVRAETVVDAIDATLNTWGININPISSLSGAINLYISRGFRYGTGSSSNNVNTPFIRGGELGGDNGTIGFGNLNTYYQYTRDPVTGLLATLILQPIIQRYAAVNDCYQGCNIHTRNDCLVVHGGAALDEFTHDGKTFILLPLTTTTYGLVAVPKG